MTYETLWFTTGTERQFVTTQLSTVNTFATIQPSTVNASITIQPSTVNTSINIQPSTVKHSVTIQHSTVNTVNTSVSIEPSTFNTSIHFQPSTVNTSVTIQPSTVNSSATIQSSTLNTSATIHPSTVNTSATIRPSTVNTSASIRPSTVNTSATIQPSTVNTSATIRPSSVNTSATIRPSTVNTSVTIRPSTVNTSVTIRPSTVNTSATIRPSTVNNSVIIRPSTVNTSATIRPSTVNTSATIRPSTVNTSATIRPSTVNTSATIRPSTVNISATIRPSTVNTSATIRPSTINNSVTIQPSTVNTSVLIQPSTVNASISIQPSTLNTYETITPSTEYYYRSSIFESVSSSRTKTDSTFSFKHTSQGWYISTCFMQTRTVTVLSTRSLSLRHDACLESTITETYAANSSNIVTSQISVDMSNQVYASSTPQWVTPLSSDMTVPLTTFSHMTTHELINTLSGLLNNTLTTPVPSMTSSMLHSSINQSTSRQFASSTLDQNESSPMIAEQTTQFVTNTFIPPTSLSSAFSNFYMWSIEEQPSSSVIVQTNALNISTLLSSSILDWSMTEESSSEGQQTTMLDDYQATNQQILNYTISAEESTMLPWMTQIASTTDTNTDRFAIIYSEFVASYCSSQTLSETTRYFNTMAQSMSFYVNDQSVIDNSTYTGMLPNVSSSIPINTLMSVSTLSDAEMAPFVTSFTPGNLNASKLYSSTNTDASSWNETGRVNRTMTNYTSPFSQSPISNIFSTYYNSTMTSYLTSRNSWTSESYQNTTYERDATDNTGTMSEYIPVSNTSSILHTAISNMSSTYFDTAITSNATQVPLGYTSESYQSTPYVTRSTRTMANDMINTVYLESSFVMWKYQTVTIESSIACTVTWTPTRSSTLTTQWQTGSVTYDNAGVKINCNVILSLFLLSLFILQL